MSRLFINESDHATPGFLVATDRGLIIWAGPAKDLHKAGGKFDALHCHSSDGAAIRRVAAAKNIPTNAAA